VIALAGLTDKPAVTWCQRACSFDDVG